MYSVELRDAEVKHAKDARMYIYIYIHTCVLKQNSTQRVCREKNVTGNYLSVVYFCQESFSYVSVTKNFQGCETRKKPCICLLNERTVTDIMSFLFAFAKASSPDVWKMLSAAFVIKAVRDELLLMRTWVVHLNFSSLQPRGYEF